jgi:hypothetical protein
MKAPLAWAALASVMLAAGCATPPAVVLTPAEQYDPESVVVRLHTPLEELPPIEPVEPPPLDDPAPAPIAPAPAAPPPDVVTPPPVPRLPLPDPPATVAALMPSRPPAPVAAAPAEPTEDQQMLALLADLQRYSALEPVDMRRELGAATTALGRQRSDANRVRLAVLYTLVRASPQDDQRALQLFENVAKSNPGPTPIKQLAAVLQAQVSERQKAVRDEQKKADEAIQKLEALRALERSLLRDRVRGGGDGGGGGGGAGGSGGR